MKVTVLIENTDLNNTGLTYEHGLSLWIEYRGKRILLDAGQSWAFMTNAEKLGINLSGADLCILSHGHYDHSDGFLKYLKKEKSKKLYMMRAAFGDYYTDAKGSREYIGISPGLKDVLKDRAVLIDAAGEIYPGVFAVPHSTPETEEIGRSRHLYCRCGGTYAGDGFGHEVSYVFKIEKGIVIFNSCSHIGMMNIVREVLEAFPDEKIYAYVGGLHMKGFDGSGETCTFTEAELDRLCAEINDSGIERIYTGHCTGTVGYGLLKERLGNILNPLTTGAEFEIE